jgi:hypothetical protein
MNALLLFSLFDSDDALLGLGSMSPATSEHLALMGAILLPVVVVIAGMLLRRRLRRQRSGRHEHSRRRHSHNRTATGVAELKQMIHAKPRHRHREHRPRNPTLAETGGLPPVRSAEPLMPPQPRPQPE